MEGPGITVLIAGFGLWLVGSATADFLAAKQASSNVVISVDTNVQTIKGTCQLIGFFTCVIGACAHYVKNTGAGLGGLSTAFGFYLLGTSIPIFRSADQIGVCKEGGFSSGSSSAFGGSDSGSATSSDTSTCASVIISGILLLVAFCIAILGGVLSASKKCTKPAVGAIVFAFGCFLTTLAIEKWHIVDSGELLGKPLASNVQTALAFEGFFYFVGAAILMAGGAIHMASANAEDNKNYDWVDPPKGAPETEPLMA